MAEDNDDPPDLYTNPLSLLGDLPPELAHETLPGGGELDPDLLDDAVRELNRVHTLSGLATTRALGETVIQLFAAGDADAFRLGQRKHVTYAALAARVDLNIEPDVLSRAVQVPSTEVAAK